jgi:hypothetical protein
LAHGHSTTPQRRLKPVLTAVEPLTFPGESMPQTQRRDALDDQDSADLHTIPIKTHVNKALMAQLERDMKAAGYRNRSAYIRDKVFGGEGPKRKMTAAAARDALSLELIELGHRVAALERALNRQGHLDDAAEACRRLLSEARETFKEITNT